MGILPLGLQSADVAQLAERRFRKPQVVGSIPTIGSSKIKGLRQRRSTFPFIVSPFCHTWDILGTNYLARLRRLLRVG